jgi:glutamate--cysteine ligase
VAAICFAAAADALPRLGASPAVRAAVAEFTDRYVARGRCPADDLLDGTEPLLHGKDARP